MIFGRYFVIANLKYTFYKDVVVCSINTLLGSTRFFSFHKKAAKRSGSIKV